jgi:predicted signal transduction protein with EAL and GGDEF domain
LLDFIIRTLAAVKGTGVSVAIDDFGAGFSLPSVLRQLRADRLKIDRVFVNEIGNIGDRGSVARLAVDLRRSLSMSVIAKAVETEDQSAALRPWAAMKGRATSLPGRCQANNSRYSFATNSEPASGPACNRAQTGCRWHSCHRLALSIAIRRS